MCEPLEDANKGRNGQKEAVSQGQCRPELVASQLGEETRESLVRVKGYLAGQ